MSRRKSPAPPPPEPEETLPELDARLRETSGGHEPAQPEQAKGPAARPQPRQMVWVCRCGETFAETGSGSGYGRWAHHLSRRQEGCRGEGLIDADTGELLVAFTGNAMQTLQHAMRLGYMPPKEERDRLREQERLARGVAPEAAPPGAAAPRNLEAVVPLERIALPAWVWALKLSTDPFLLKQDGTPYGWSAEDKAEWLADMLEIGWHAVMLQDPARALGVPPDQAEQLVQANFFQHFLARLKGMPEPELTRSLRELGAHHVQPAVVAGGR